jgi:hypothetical protein
VLRGHTAGKPVTVMAQNPPAAFRKKRFMPASLSINERAVRLFGSSRRQYTCVLRAC